MESEPLRYLCLEHTQPPTVATGMHSSSSLSHDSVALCVGLTVATASVAALCYLANKNEKHTKPAASWQQWRSNNSRRSRSSSSSISSTTTSSSSNNGSGKGGEFGRYPYPYAPRAKGSVPSTTPVRYGEDGRRRLARSTHAVRDDDVLDEQTESRRVDPRRRALSSSDVLLHVMSYIGRGDIMEFGTSCVVCRETATDDTIWIHYTKSLTANLLTADHVAVRRAKPRGFSPSCLMDAGLGRVMDLVYAKIPRAYLDIYPRLPPTREVPAPRKARKSWHRLWITIVWVRYAQLNAKLPGAPVSRLVLERTSRLAMGKYGATAYFPDQVFSFVSFLFWACCTDYWGELSQRIPPALPPCGDPAVPRRPERTFVPPWADMFSVLHGYLRRYKGRRFVNFQDNMGFLLQDPECAATTSSDESGGHDNEQGVVDPRPRLKRQLRIPCTHRVLIMNLSSPVPRLQAWPFKRKMTLDGLLAQFSEWSDDI